MVQLTAPPPSAPFSQTSPPRRWPLLFLPVILAILGILIASACAISGQDVRRDTEYLKMENDLSRAELALAQSQIRHDDPATQDAFRQAVEQQKNRQLLSYARYGRQFTQWDGWRYEEIITLGYLFHHPGDSEALKQSPTLIAPGETEPRLKNVVWYPLYPVLGWLVSKTFGISAATALTVIAQACAILAALMLFLFARRHYYNQMPPLPEANRRELPPHETAALWAVVALLFGPCGIFLYANFTESLFVLLLASFLYCLQGRWWWRAALIAAFASSCRAQGVLFGPILALVFLLRGDLPHPLAKWGKAFLLGVLSSIGIGCYMIYLQQTFGDALAFMHAQQSWNVGLHLPQILTALNPLNALNHFTHYAIYTRPVDWPRVWESSCVIWPPILLVLGRRYLSLELNVVGWLLWGLPYVSNSLAGNPPGNDIWMSMGRFMLVLIPAYMVLGRFFARFRWLGITWLILWAAAFGVFSFKFGLGQWIG